MIISQNYEIKSCDDVELEVKRESKLEFRLCFDDEKEIEALLFIINGCGGDADTNYREHLASFAAENFNVAVVSVNYHCVGNMPQTGATAYLDEIDTMILEESCKALNINANFDISKARVNFSKDLLYPIYLILDEKKKKKELLENFLLNLHVTIKPTKNEYQNFGIMQAQDLINALLHIKANPPFKMYRGGGFESYYVRKFSRRISFSFSS